eukprot:scaffold65962_cov25-Tisochrysis_lutea.AAC.7
MPALMRWRSAGARRYRRVPARVLPSRATSGRSSRPSRPMHHTSHVTDPHARPASWVWAKVVR